MRLTWLTQPVTIRQADVVIVATKTYDTEAALAPLKGLKVQSALSVENGVLKNQQLSYVFGPQAVLGAIAMMGGNVLLVEGDRPRAVRHIIAAPVKRGQTPLNAMTCRVIARVKQWRESFTKNSSSIPQHSS